MLGWFSFENYPIFLQLHCIGIKFEVGLNKILNAHIDVSHIFLGYDWLIGYCLTFEQYLGYTKDEKTFCNI